MDPSPFNKEEQIDTNALLDDEPTKSSLLENDAAPNALGRASLKSAKSKNDDNFS